MNKLLLLIFSLLMGYNSLAFTAITPGNYRWRNDDGSETAATWRKPANTSDSLTARSQNVRLRMGFTMQGTVYSGSSTDAEVQLWCTPPGGGTSFQITASSGQFKLGATTYFADMDSTSNQFGESNFTPGDCFDMTNDYTFTSTDESTAFGSECEWSIQADSTAVSGTYTFYLQAVTGFVIPGPFSNAILNTSFTSTWTGVTSNDWNDTTNWLPNIVPNRYRDAHIPVVSTVYPVSAGSPIASTYNTILDAGTSLSIQAFGRLFAYGSIFNSGHIDVDASSAATVNHDLVNNGEITGGTAANFYSSIVGGLSINDTSAISGNGVIDNLFLLGNATIDTGDTLHIKKMLMLYDFITLTTNNGLTLMSDSSFTALIPTLSSGATVIGNTNVQQYIPGSAAGGRRAFRFMGHPFSSAISLSQLEQYIDITGQGGSSNGFTSTSSNNPSSFYYNPVTGSGSTTADSTGWLPFTNTSDTWARAQGIRALIRGAKGQGLDGTVYSPNPVTYTLTGLLNTGSFSTTLHAGDTSNYNMVGNPYPSPINIGALLWNQSVMGGGTAIAGSAYWVWNPYMATQGAYEAKILSSSDNYKISANTSFMVAAAADGVSLNFAELNKSITYNTPLLRTTQSGNYTHLALYTNGTQLWDEMYVSFTDDAAAVKDKYDAAKPQNPELNFYTYSADGKQLCIDARPYVKGDVIQLGLVDAPANTYTLIADKFSVPAGGSLYLHDKYLNQYVQLTQGTTYTFTVTADKKSQGDARFELTTEMLPGNLNASNGVDMNLGPNPASESITVNYMLSGIDNPTLHVINSVGQEVYTNALGTTQSGSINVPVNELAAGMYMVKITNGKKEKAQKFVKQ